MLRMSRPGGEISPKHEKMIRRMFNFSERPANQMMVPLINVVGVSKDSTCGVGTRLASESGHRNLAVYDGRVDRIIGMVHSLELLGVNPEQPVSQYIRPVRYVAGVMPAHDLLQELRQSNESIAVVINEYGAARGIITAEDIMEEVVYDIEDEFDAEKEPTQWVRKLGDQDYVVSGLIELDRLKDELGIKIRKGNYATLAGYLLEKSFEVPKEGAVIESHGISYTIKRRSDRLIKEVGISW